MLPWLLAACAATSLLHFAHNARYLAHYPNLPSSWTATEVWLAWCVVTAIGLSGYGLYRTSARRAGLALLAIYGVLGLGGLLHYIRAPMTHHSAGMNFTIWIEVLTATVFLLNLAAVAASGQGPQPSRSYSISQE